MSLFRNPGRFAGLLYVLTSVLGFFAMEYVPSKLVVRADAAATASNIAGAETLFRFGIAAHLVGQVGFIFVALALYDVFKGINRRQAVLMVGLIVVSIPVTFLNEVNSLAALALIRGADYLSVVDATQRNALALFFLHLHSRGILLAELFWGLWLFPLAVLVYNSRFLPRFLGVWLGLAGAAWVVLSFTGILAPEYLGGANRYLQPVIIGEIVFMFWLLIKGANPPAETSVGSPSMA